MTSDASAARPAEVLRGIHHTAHEWPWVEWALRSTLLVLYAWGVARLIPSYLANPGHVTLALMLVAESISLFLVLISRRAVTRDTSLLTLAATTYAMVPVVLLSADGTARLVPEALAASIQIAALALQLWAKLTLGRRFGALPAQRGSIVVSGPYRLVRHPMYLGYLIGQLGFLAANCSLRNVAVYGLLTLCQVHRIRREEAVLGLDPAYAALQSRVRWRFVPGLW